MRDWITNYGWIVALGAIVLYAGLLISVFVAGSRDDEIIDGFDRDDESEF